ncbi:P-loop containing nucleoside triphosphate hydrolase protein [Aspergillus ruber CBS 135680]|uniref:p-loop containing nucleoside triphosphate hydrolase protein n=1 Tax=Aspergillus ruber (strain CBS 135680) TaxID=1388766 RepID=A0A017SIG3_ASPRC|nr:P-loop containing nucleoside triphosphate hydrolase protein [Aspergillus ruber CBS 135680]EYE96762.1 P-loop containing nucleoside triphosphate hydrolase protein [Aspergillus ruber CBS 135680]
MSISKLQTLARQARRLIDEGDGVLQDVVRALSTEGGLRRIRELVENDYNHIPAAAKPSVFRAQMLPFLDIITNPNILESLVLEQAVGTIYNVLYGNSGRRGVVLLGFLADVFSVSMGEKPTTKTLNHFELSLLVFWQIIRLNSLAFVHESFKPVAVRFEEIFKEFYSEDTVNFLRTSRNYLERTLRHLEIGSSLPTVDGMQQLVKKSHLPEVSFVTTCDPPGGRHDNDYADICRVQIMPTIEEILSSRSEYLPVKDSRQWHVGGISGLLDRNFRLLREDTIGQLRDTIYALLKPSNKKRGIRSSQIRTHVHQNVHLLALNFDRLAGLQFVARIEQPVDMKNMSKKKREEWWQGSKRLQQGALVCLCFGAKNTIFCTVAGDPRPRRNKDGEMFPLEKMCSLWEEKETATVLLELAQLSEDKVKCILSQYKSRMAVALSLVEFPGILLASFEPTLRALQQVKRSDDLPFPQLLSPLDPEGQFGTMTPPLPAYALRNGFTFDLSCLLKDPTVPFTMRPGEPVDIARLQKYSTLDNAQAVAVVNSLQRCIGLIQGPPGTGKSYTGVALIKVLIQALLASKRGPANRRKAGEDLGPIICVCYTNHALDQLLEDLLEKRITTQIVRIGSRSKSEKLEQFNLRNIPGQKNKTKAEKRDQWELHRDFDDIEKEFGRLSLEPTNSEGKLKSFLERHYPRHHQQLYGKDEEGYERTRASRKGPVLKGWLNHGGVKTTSGPRSLAALQDVHVDSMSQQERQRLHEYWVAEIRRDAHDTAGNLLERQRRTKVQFDNIRDELNMRCLRDAHIIGVTTTGLARNLNMLRRLRSKIVVCEEAGEVLESHLLTALLPSVEHLILIGDHMQLRPQVQNYNLSRENHNGGEQYSLDVSLFERLVNPDEGTGIRLPYSTLETQRRMHPSIAQLVRETLYHRLEDAPSVSQYPEVSGMRKRLFWLDHRHQEGSSSKDDALGTSHWNSYEVEMTLALVNHLVRQGTYKSGEIAVLTPYLGQLHFLRSKFRESFAITLGERDETDLENAGLNDEVPETQQRVVKTNLLQTLRVATIDNFQGEEAKVIVISLVRSNDQNRCGFLRTSNRINVLLSRAKHGMYIVGNSATSIHVPMWAQVIDILQQEGNFGAGLELQCPRHPDHPISVSEPEDFLQYSPEGGCNERCMNRLKCGHVCKQKCHSAILHDAVYCQEPCPKVVKGCDHTCPKLCGELCPAKCTVSVRQAGRRLLCGHIAEDLPCWQAQNVSLVRCSRLVEKQVPGCDHKVIVQCHVNVARSGYRCDAPCKANLSCGHTCRQPCWKCTVRTPEGVTVDHGKCLQVCGRNQSTCVHACNQTCHRSEPCPPCSMPCEIQCAHSKCPRLCAEPCTPCAVSTCLSACPHSQCSMPCAAPCDHIPCTVRCEKRLACSHQCPSVCGEACPSPEFCQKCASPELKERVVDFILAETYAEIDLDENPCIFPRCGHFLTIESMDGQMDMKKYYVMEDSKPVAIRSSSEPFSVDDIKRCATCRGSLRDLSRYGRLVRRAILDESTKRFLLYLNREYVPLAQELPLQLAAVLGSKTDLSPLLIGEQATINIGGSRDKQFQQMAKIVRESGGNRWRQVTQLRSRIVQYYKTVEEREQPFSRVQALVESARRRKATSGNFEFDGSVVQTKGVFLATTLLMRLDISLLGDFLSLFQASRTGVEGCKLQINLQATREECRGLIKRAENAMRVAHKVEGYIFLAQLYALERSQSEAPTVREKHAERAREAIASARKLCHRHPGQTNGLSSEINEAEEMLKLETFYTAVTSDERLEIIAAMAREFRGTGHWYYCQNGHPFTIGECGGAVQLAICPECGARVGGQGHRTVDGVTRADDLERELEQLRV